MTVLLDTCGDCSLTPVVTVLLNTSVYVSKIQKEKSLIQAYGFRGLSPQPLLSQAHRAWWEQERMAEKSQTHHSVPGSGRQVGSEQGEHAAKNPLAVTCSLQPGPSSQNFIVSQVLTEVSGDMVPWGHGTVC